MTRVVQNLLVTYAFVNAVFGVSQPHYEHPIMAEMFDHPLTKCQKCDVSRRLCLIDCYTPVGPPGTNQNRIPEIPEPYGEMVGNLAAEINLARPNDVQSEINLSNRPVGPPGGYSGGHMPGSSGSLVNSYGSGPSPGRPSDVRVNGPPGRENTHVRHGPGMMTQSSVALRDGQYKRFSRRTRSTNVPYFHPNAIRFGAGPPGIRLSRMSLRSSPNGPPGRYSPVGAPIAHQNYVPLRSSNGPPGRNSEEGYVKPHQNHVPIHGDSPQGPPGRNSPVEKLSLSGGLAYGPPGGNNPVGRPGVSDNKVPVRKNPNGSPGGRWQGTWMLKKGRRCAADCMFTNNLCRKTNCYSSPRGK